MCGCLVQYSAPGVHAACFDLELDQDVGQGTTDQALWGSKDRAAFAMPAHWKHGRDQS